MASNRLRRNYRFQKLPCRAVSHGSNGAVAPASNSRPSVKEAVRFDRLISRTALLKTSHPPLVSSDALAVSLPVPPSINHLYASVNGRRLLSSAGRAYKIQVGQQVWLALAQSPVRLLLQDRLQSGPLVISIRFFFASSLRRDLDGGLKITQDAVCEGLGINDNRIVETHLYKHVDKVNPRVELSLSPLPPLAPST
jgi:crossover junction endodeoxyribonuclease RusA